MVETDWTAASFTMNWKLTRVGQIVRFERGEPICIATGARSEMRFRLELRQATRRPSDAAGERTIFKSMILAVNVLNRIKQN